MKRKNTLTPVSASAAVIASAGLWLMPFSQRSQMRPADSIEVSVIHYALVLGRRKCTQRMTGNGPISVDAVNHMDQAAFIGIFGGVFEHSPWVALRAWKKRPFRSIDALHEAMLEAVREANRDKQLALIRAHPELAGSEATGGRLTPDSSTEQRRLGLAALSAGEFARMAELNRRYREKFGFPCIVALKLHASRASVTAEMERRRGNDAGTEIANALDQIGHIARGRLDKIMEDGKADNPRP